MVIKVCRWCKKEFETEVNNRLYCNDTHRLEAHKENVRKARNKHYSNNKRESILSQIGTTTLGKHPNKDDDREQIIIQNEKKRTFITTVYKGKSTYNKGFTIFTQFPKINDTHLGSQITHNYATFIDYSNQHTQNLFKQNITKCPECKSDFIEKDNKHATVNCGDCGLVLLGPPIMGIIYPYRIYSITNQLAPIFNGEYHPLPQTKKETRKEMVKVICKSCYSPYTIQLRDKGDFRCECGNKVIGIGMCLPHDFDDEFKSNDPAEIGYDLRTTESRGIGE